MALSAKAPKRKADGDAGPVKKKAKAANKKDEKASGEVAAPIVLAEPVMWSGFKHAGKPPLKITSWNVNGLRALCKKDSALQYLQQEAMDIICVQETKCGEGEKGTEKMVEALKGYHCYWHSSTTKKGYSGTLLCSRKEPLSVQYGIGDKTLDCNDNVISFENEPVADNEGRVITAEYPGFYLVTVYTPNAGTELKRLEYRGHWDLAFRLYCQRLDKKKPTIITGDFNVAHKEIDIARPKSNYNKSAGFTEEECSAFSTLLTEQLGKDDDKKGEDRQFIDTFRKFYPEAPSYTYWGYRFKCKEKNIGWRLDYFLTSSRLLPHVGDQTIRAQVSGSDHCPVTLHLAGLEV